MKRGWIIALGLMLAACETVPTSGTTAPTASASIPSAPLDLGDWRNATEAATLASFQQTVAARYGAGLTVSAVTADLRRSEFTCGEPPRGEGRGTQANEVCRRTTTAAGCTHTWQVHLFEVSAGQVASTRGLYDRRCGGDGLLGGPG